MWAHLLVVPVALAAGCAQLAGLDETSGDGRVPVSLSFERVSIGGTVVRAPLDVSALPATYLVLDAAAPGGLARVDAATRPDDPSTWSAELFEPAPILFELPEANPSKRSFDFPNKTLLGGFQVLEHQNPVPVDPTATIAVNLTFDVAYNGEGLQLFTLGSWNQRNLEPPVVGAVSHAVPPFAMSTMTSLTGRPHERIIAADSVVALRYIGNQLTGFGDVAPFEQTGNDTISAAIATVAADKVLDLQIDPTGAQTRYSAARPAVGSFGASWSVRAAPGFELGNDNGPLLHAAGVMPTDTTATAMYANPFAARGWRSMLTWSTSASRSFQPAGLVAAVQLSAGMFQRDVDPAVGLVLDLPAGLPELISLDGQNLSTDGVTIATPAAAVTVTFVPDRPANTFYQLELFELSNSADGLTVERRRTYAGAAAQPSFTLPPELFEPGKTYHLRAQSVLGGFPNIADGDLRTRTSALAIAFVDSGVFTVMP